MKILKMKEVALTCFSVEVQSDTRADITYYVQHRGGAQTICTCPDFMHRSFIRGQACKHMAAVFEAVQQAGGWVEFNAQMNPTPAGASDG